MGSPLPASSPLRPITGRPRKATGHWTDNIASVVRLPADDMSPDGVDGFLCPCPAGSGIISKCRNGTLVTLLALIVVRERRKDWRNRLLGAQRGQADHEQAIRSFSGAGRAC